MQAHTIPTTATQVAYGYLMGLLDVDYLLEVGYAYWTDDDMLTLDEGFALVLEDAAEVLRLIPTPA